MQVQTPTKDVPPSLGFGSSSSPYVESPSTVTKGMRPLAWTPLEMRKSDVSGAISSSQLLPSQFPPATFSSLESSPPDAGRQFGSYPSVDHSASPQPTIIKRIGKRGRPRKYTIEASDSLAADNKKPLLQQEPSSVYGFSTSVSLNDMFSVPQAPATSSQAEQAAPASHSRSRRSSERSLKTNRLHPQQKSSKHAKRVAKQGAQKKRALNKPFPVFTNAKTKNGIPLFSSRIFELACQHQSDIRGTEASALRDVLAERGENQSQFSTNGLGFNFSIDISGKVSIEATTKLGSSEHSKSALVAPFAQYPLALVKEESESDSDEECSDSVDLSERTPPRFSSLGSCDAATAFAKSLARTNDNGNGFMFLFPPVSTPDKHAQLTSYVPCTPRTPRIPLPFDETSFSLQMQTPPGAMFPYDSPGNLYTTGMTPYLASARSAC